MLRKIPLPISINYFWNFRSMLRGVYTCQLISRILLSLRYHASTGSASFDSVENIVREVEHGISIRGMHLARSQIIILLIYLHMLRSLIYRRRVNAFITLQRTVILIMTMGAAFLGYVLPWGQMSFWRATVITRFLRVLPFRDDILKWVWGGFTVRHPTLVRFFSLHYLLRLAIAPLSLMHILILHQKGSGSPLGDYSDCYLPFWPYFGIKDSWPIATIFLTLLFLSYTLVPETENIKNANPISTPTHIKPEWYFLIIYAILRAVPSKVRRLILIGLSIAIFIVLILRRVNFSSSPVTIFYLANFIRVCFMLRFLRRIPVEEPYLTSSILLSFIYFTIIRVALAFF